MKTLQQKLKELKSQNKTGLSFFLTGGYPSMEYFKELLLFLDREKLADFVEIGIPFSDPVADGPVIQSSSVKAIKNGANFFNILKTVKDIKDKIELPLVLMSYLNIVYSRWEKNLILAKEAGFSASIFPDLPVDEYKKIIREGKKDKLPVVLLTTPACSKKRIKEISSLSRPFIYYVSSYGVTGHRDKLKKKRLARDLKKMKNNTDKPVYCGFGISTPRQADFISRYADGLIIGTAVIELISEDKTKTFKEIKKFGISIRDAVS